MAKQKDKELKEKKLRVLIACEESQEVCKAFRELGHEAFSCDILPCSGGHPEWHIQDDVLKHLNDGWDLMIAHPPCTHLAVSGACWFKYKKIEQEKALKFVKVLLNARIKKICLENPVSIISTRIRKPTQIIQPYMFGHPEQKKTCLWLKGIPELKSINNVKKEMDKLPKNKRERLHYLPPSKERSIIRSKTFPGIAKAMAEQWGQTIKGEKGE